MSAIVQHIELTWRGERYRVNVNFRLINEIEQDVDLLHFCNNLTPTTLCHASASVIFYHMLSSAGAIVTPDDVWKDIFDDVDAETMVNLITTFHAIADLFFAKSERKTLKKETSQPASTCQWAEFYKIIVGHFGFSPSDFWEMTPREAHLVIDAKTPEEKVGDFTISEVEELTALHEELGCH